MDTVAGTALDAFVHHGLPWMGKKAFEMGRYYGSEALRNPKLQKKAIDCALDNLNPMINENTTKEKLQNKQERFRWWFYRYPQADWQITKTRRWLDITRA